MRSGQQPDSITNETTSSPAVTRLQSQQERAMLQEEREALMPMKEVVGAEGLMQVLGPESDADINEAMIHVCNPKNDLTKWETDLRQFVGQYRPTMLQLRRLMGKVLKHDYHKIRNVFNIARMTFHLSEPLYEDPKNLDFRDAVDVLIATVKETFHLKLNLSDITSLSQGPQETCSFCLSRLTTAFNTQCSFTGHSPRGTQTLEQCKDHLEERFVSGTRPKLRQMVRKSYVPRTDVLKHAEHAKTELHRKEMLAMINTLARQIRNIPPWQLGRTRGRGRGRMDLTLERYDSSVCYNGGGHGHWRTECPEPKKEDPLSTRLSGGRRGRGGSKRRTTLSRENNTSHTGESCTSLTSHCDPASPETRRLGAHQGSQEKALEAETRHGSLPSTPDHRDGGESGRKSNMGPR
ncbi:uncharacterized protein LOC130206629 [Pseudoliparis swirei]|uniref:uncharacterized protein LOC130206629 n=1 Tax=Pseudoliparis swirei TaxID=2059687 RepID=UPI0024BDAE9F|nr:uncharacterized protein LOC130206629 [Pseudoliparis swirei]